MGKFLNSTVSPSIDFSSIFSHVAVNQQFSVNGPSLGFEELSVQIKEKVALVLEEAVRHKEMEANLSLYDDASIFSQ